MDDEDLKAHRQAAIEADKCFTSGRLRDEFRMKPAPGAAPVKWYKGQYGKYAVYRIADCVSVRKKREPTEKQRLSGIRLARQSRLNSARGQVSVRALSWLDKAPLFLDTETTGLGRDAQVIEIGLVDTQGLVVFETRLKPSVSIEPEALAVHGIDVLALSDEPVWPDIVPRLLQAAGNHPLVIFNADYDLRILRQTAVAYDDPASWLDNIQVFCAMNLAADYFGATSRYGSISLANAAHQAGVLWPDRAHAAVTDARVTAEVVAFIADYYRTISAE
ncbi:3'-5' exonuclease [Klebsiella huaxiensis]|uniref:3'-5' exonuclease n=1 Tax=Klebsiella huaxiensis TaxID=2153354 RepID=UPI002F2F34AE